MLTKFTLNNGRHFYIEVPSHVYESFAQTNSPHKFLIANDRKFEFAGKDTGMPAFQEAEILEIKVANLAQNLFQKSYKLAQALSDSLAPDNESSQDKIERHIKNISIKSDNSLIQQIRELKKGSLYPRDKVKIRILWWEAKRNSYRDALEKANVSLEERSFVSQVLEELGNRITIALKEYNDFPEK